MKHSTPLGTHGVSRLWATILIIVLTQCLGLYVGAEAAEEAELCKWTRTYREEGCKGGRECIKREVEWKPCRRATPTQILTNKFRDLSRTLFEYMCEKECTSDGEVRCKVRKERTTIIGVRG